MKYKNKLSIFKSIDNLKSFYKEYNGSLFGVQRCISVKEWELFKEDVDAGIYLGDGITRTEISGNLRDYLREFENSFDCGYHEVNKKIYNGLSPEIIFDNMCNKFGAPSDNEIVRLFKMYGLNLRCYRMKTVDGESRKIISKGVLREQGWELGELIAYVKYVIDHPNTFYPDEIGTVKAVEPIVVEFQDPFEVLYKYIEEIRKNFIENEIESNLTDVTRACMCADFSSYGHKGKRGKSNNTNALCKILSDIYNLMKDKYDIADQWRNKVCESMGYSVQEFQTKASKYANNVKK